MKVTVVGDMLVWGDIVLGPANVPLVAHGEPLHVPNEVRATLAPMPGGDVVVATVSGVVGLERKTLNDLVSSHASVHLATQLGIMLDCYDHVLLAVECNAFPWVWPDVAALAQDLLTYQEVGVRVVLCLDSASLSTFVERLPAYYARKTHHALDRTGPQDSAVYRRMVSAAPGWGPEMTRAALATIGLPIEVFNASSERLVTVRGVTPRKVQQLFTALGRRIHVSRRVERRTTHGYRHGDRPTSQSHWSPSGDLR